MPIRVYDYRRDNQNLVVTPEIRARFMRLWPGEVADRHSHDLGHEAFLVLEGRLEVEVNGETAVLEPGQFCFSRAHELHQVKNVGDGPVMLYLSVTPHVEPTHTAWSAAGERLPPRYGGVLAWNRQSTDTLSEQLPLAEHARRLAQATQQLTSVLAAAAEAQGRLLAQVERLVQPGEASHPDELKPVIDALWAALYPVFRDVPALEAAWNALAVAAAGNASGSAPR